MSFSKQISQVIEQSLDSELTKLSVHIAEKLQVEVEIVVAAINSYKQQPEKKQPEKLPSKVVKKEDLIQLAVEKLGLKKTEARKLSKEELELRLNTPNVEEPKPKTIQSPPVVVPKVTTAPKTKVEPDVVVSKPESPDVTDAPKVKKKAPVKVVIVPSPKTKVVEPDVVSETPDTPKVKKKVPVKVVVPPKTKVQPDVKEKVAPTVEKFVKEDELTVIEVNGFFIERNTRIIINEKDEAEGVLGKDNKILPLSTDNIRWVEQHNISVAKNALINSASILAEDEEISLDDEEKADDDEEEEVIEEEEEEDGEEEED